jgi:hypothetical protein
MPTPSPRVSVRTRRVALAGLAIITFSLCIAATIVTYQRHQPPVQKINYSQLYAWLKRVAQCAHRRWGDFDGHEV